MLTKNQKELINRFHRKPPSSTKNPRKLKKAWKKAVLEIVEMQHGGYPGVRYKVFWVPCVGWTVEFRNKYPEQSRP